MRTVSLLLFLGFFSASAVAAAETFKNVPVVDSNCSKKVADAPDSHTRDCALKCEGSGYGIVTNDKKFLKCDAEGNNEIATALKASSKNDHLRVDVTGDVQGDTGDVQGDTLKVTSIKLL